MLEAFDEFDEVAKRVLDMYRSVITELLFTNQVETYYELALQKDLDSRRVNFEVLVTECLQDKDDILNERFILQNES